MSDKPFEFFIDNFHGKNQLEQLKSALLSDIPHIINVCPFNEIPDVLYSGYDEQSRLGGLGKTMAIRESWKYYSEEIYNKKVKKTKHQAPIIDLAEQITTKKDILLKIVQLLGEYFDSGNSIEKIFNSNEDSFFNQFLAEPEWDKIIDKSSFDPSYVAERLFDLATKEKKFKSTFEALAPPIIFFDGFDAQYLGQAYSPLRTWLTNKLFPYLSIEMGIKVFVSGREKIPYSNAVSSDNIHHFFLLKFNAEQVCRYLSSYPKRYAQRSIDEIPWLNLVPVYSAANSSIYEKLAALTDGKPIFLDFFADMLNRQSLVAKKFNSIEEALRNISKNIESDNSPEAEQRNFKEFIIDRLQYHHQGIKNEISDTALAIDKLAIARHGLNAADFVALNEKTSEPTRFFENEILYFDKFFKNSFTQERLSFVKDRGDKRLLHDEVADLFTEYIHEKNDPDHKERNKDLKFLLNQYSHKMNTIVGGRENHNYAKLLLEYIDYAFKYQGREQECKAINRFMYECSYYLDSFFDLNSRLLDKGLKYFYTKTVNYNKAGGDIDMADKTLTITTDYHLLAKIRFREAEYCLTERLNNWVQRIEGIIDESAEYAKTLTGARALSLKARVAIVKGELDLWRGNGDEARKNIRTAKQLFYRIADAHGVLWCDHLLGFEDQRNARFDHAIRHHADAIAGAIQYFPNLERLAMQEIKEGNDCMWAYRLRFLNRILSRANGNLALYFRYKGRIVDAIKILKSNENLAKSVGIREPIRLSSSLLQFFSIVNREEERRSENSRVKAKLHRIEDPLLPKRLALSLLVSTIKEIGMERHIYRLLPDEFAVEKKLDKSDFKKFEEALNIAVEALQPEKYLQVNSDKLPAGRTAHLEDLLKKFENEPGLLTPNRETADLFYQIGKLLLSSRDSSKGRYRDLAYIAFNLGRKVAKDCNFIYLEMEANEALFRLCFLFQDYREKISLFQTNFIQLQKKISADTAYGVYHDILAKFQTTCGDLVLKSALESGTISDDFLDISLRNYADALLHGHKHNQERYLMILDIFATRIQTILEKVGKSSIEEVHSMVDRLNNKMVHFTICKPSDPESDNTFKIFFETLLKAIILKLANKPVEENQVVMAEIKHNIIFLMGRGKFVKAADIDQVLIEYFKSQNNERELFFRYFQLCFCMHGANRSRMANKVIDDIIADYKLDIHPKKIPDIYSSWKHGIIAVVKATSIYRTGDFWSIEKFILGELSIYNKDADTRKVITNAKRMLIAAIKTLITEGSFHDKSTLRVVTEALIRLGELFLFLELEKGSEKEFLEWMAGVLNKYFEKKSVNLKTEFGASPDNFKLRIDDSPAIFCLNYAYYLAKAISDNYRQANALQYIAVARYLLGQTTLDESYEKSILDNIHQKVNQIITPHKGEDSSSIKHRSPLIAANLYFIEGNIHFSKLFEVEQTPDINGIKCNLRNSVQQLNSSNDQVLIDQKIRHYLHEMMWAYLSALNELSDPSKPYENYHFNNMAFEVTRRILLIEIPDLIHILQENIRPIWSEFSKMASKHEFRESLENSILIHQISAVSMDIFDEIK